VLARRLLVFFLTAGLVIGALGLLGCDSADSPASPKETPPAAATDTAAPDSAAERRALQVARRRIARTDSLFRAVEPLSAAEKQRLRRYLQNEHMARARRLGLAPVRTRRAAADLEQQPDSTVARLHTNDYYIVDPAMGYAVPLVVPSTKHLLARLGRRFQNNLLQRGLPPYRFVLTNLLRTGQDQAALSGENVNAARGQSTHEYGTTFDVFYEWFHHAPVHDTLAQHAPSAADSTRANPLDEQVLRRQLYDAYVRFGKEHARKIKAVLGRTILEMQDEGLLLAIYERQEPVFHLTTARPVAPPEPTRFPPPSDSTRTTAAAASAANTLSFERALQ
jgi:hypothetical protein